MTNNTTLPGSYSPKGTIITAVLMSAVFSIALTGCSDAARTEGANAVDLHAGNDHASVTAADSGAHASHSDADGHHATGAHAHATRLEFTSAPSDIVAGTPSTWRLRIVDATSGDPIPEFELSHEKLMHLIVVSKDLSWFNHLHPEYQGNGEFTIEAVLPRNGAYKLYADYTPKGGTQEVAQHELATAASATSAADALVADRVAQGGWMIRSTVARPEGEPDVKGTGEYQVAMMPMPKKITAGKDVMLHFQVRDAKGTPLTDLEPYLGALGHAVLLSSDTKTYLHTHPMDAEMDGMDHGSGGHDNHGAAPAGGSDVIFHTNFPTAGLYKVWGQFQHKGKIITAAFVVSVA